jgi:hypothetical protein
MPKKQIIIVLISDFDIRGSFGVGEFFCGLVFGQLAICAE